MNNTNNENNSVYKNISNLIQPNTKEEVTLLREIKNYLREIPFVNKELTLLQLRRVLTEDNLMLTKDGFPSFSPKTRDLFLIKHYLINYYADIHRTDYTNKTEVIEVVIRKCLGNCLPRLDVDSLLLAIKADSSYTSNSKTLTIRSHLAKLFTENYTDGSNQLVRAIIDKGNSWDFIKAMNDLELYEKHMLGHHSIKEYVKRTTAY